MPWVRARSKSTRVSNLPPPRENPFSLIAPTHPLSFQQIDPPSPGGLLGSINILNSMAPIPFSLIISNASTVLSWLCVYAPHDVLLSLLMIESLTFLALVVGAVVYLFKLFRDGCLWLASLTNRSALVQPLSHNNGHMPRPRLNLRRYSNPTSPVTLLCPRCLEEITPRVPLPVAPSRKPRFHLPEERRLPIRRVSDVTPEIGTFKSLDSFPSDTEQPITTPPRVCHSPPKTPLRRSPQPHKPRKLE